MLILLKQSKLNRLTLKSIYLCSVTKKIRNYLGPLSCFVFVFHTCNLLPIGFHILFKSMYICNNCFHSQVKTIYVKNLPENVSKEKVKDLFEVHGEVTKIVLPPAKAGHKRDFGFVHFAERSSALKAVKESGKYEIDGNLFPIMIIEWN